MYLESCIYKAELWFEVQVSLMAPKAFIVASNFILLSWLIQVDSKYIDHLTVAVIILLVFSQNACRPLLSSVIRITPVL